MRRLSLSTEEAYRHWIRRLILIHRKRHPSKMGAEEIRRFLAHLAVEAHVAASTQNQALCALLFLYRDVLRTDLPYVEGIERARRPARACLSFSPGTKWTPCSRN
jgi:site-specific recombinase XerD